MVYCYNGEGTEKDLEMAFKYYKLSAKEIHKDKIVQEIL